MKSLIVNAWAYIWKIFSSDPAASCSRILAVLCVSYVLIMGASHFGALTQTQVNFLLGVMTGCVPYALGKVSEIPGAIKSVFTPPAPGGRP